MASETINKALDLHYLHLLGAVKHALKANPSQLDQKVEELKFRLLNEMTADQLSVLRCIAQSSKNEPEAVKIVRDLIDAVVSALLNVYDADDLSLTDSDEYDPESIKENSPPYDFENSRFGAAARTICERREWKVDSGAGYADKLEENIQELSLDDFESLQFALVNDMSEQHRCSLKAQKLEDENRISVSDYYKRVLTQKLLWVNDLIKKKTDPAQPSI